MLQYKIVPVTPFMQNATIVWCDQTMQGAIIDPGGETERLLSEVDALGITLTKLLLTHAHVDHAGGAHAISTSRDIPIEGPHREDKFWIDMFDLQIQQFGFPDSESFTSSRWLEDGDTVELGNEQFEVYFCPGHTPGHVIFFHRQSKLAQVGDVLFKGSIGRTDFPKGDHPTLIASIKNKLWPLGDDVRFIPGHGPMSTFGEERRSNPYVRD
ncbi:MBL fold metallo-hydrolase [Thalassotalea ponticola]|uniref:MBL fold metallo-hydrolase n=1 Tax=Thalassotalea ponticola TaxID=1523392 RepID=UPI0025B459D7|nr:MBL fold metallo-hydrolase [Thalassotalea ponticola]MDN3651279.1 MBL fold metallo-hydrolase [Thalassotalea ponticola]